MIKKTVHAAIEIEAYRLSTSHNSTSIYTQREGGRGREEGERREAERREGGREGEKERVKRKEEEGK